MSAPSTTASNNVYMDEQQQYSRHLQRMRLDDISENSEIATPPKRGSPKENLMNLTQRISNEDLKQAIRVEVKRLVSDYDRLISMLQQRSEILEQEYESLQMTEDSYQRRYEKAVREMQFFKKKYDKAVELNKQYAAVSNGSVISGGRPRSPSLESNISSLLENNRSPPTALPTSIYGNMPTSPPPSSISGSEGTNPIYNLPPPPPPLPNSPLPSTSTIHNGEKTRHLSRSSSSSTTSSNASGTPYWSAYTSELSPAPPVPRLRQNSTTNGGANIASSIHSSSTDDSSKNGGSFNMQSKKGSWQQLQSPPLPPPTTQLPPTATHAGPAPASSVSSPPNTNTPTVQRSGTTSQTPPANLLNSQVIQQRKVDPIAFGGSDALWETIAKSKTADTTIEKMIR
jgi:hypothetical protein